MRNALLAQLRNPVLPESIGGGQNADYTTGGTALGKLIGSLVGGLLIAAFLLAFVYIIVGGFTWITAGGDKTRLEAARNQIINATMGIIIVAASWAIMTLIGGFIGINFPTIPIPSVPSSQSAPQTPQRYQPRFVPSPT